jgi:lysophospholipase L1-like esterase
MKIVFFGDSLTQGTYGANYVNKVAAAMRGHHFINQGVNGDTSLNLYRRLEQDVIAQKPDAVFIMIGINDAVSFSEPKTRLYYRYIKGIRGGQITPIAFRENLRTVLTKLRFAQIKVWVVLPPVEYRPALVDTLREMNAMAAGVCAEMQIPVLDLMAKLTPVHVPERPTKKAFPDMIENLTRRVTLKGDGYDKLRDAGNFTYTFDGIHLTEDGAQQVADAVTAFLRNNGVSG